MREVTDVAMTLPKRGNERSEFTSAVTADTADTAGG
jgi:hypothetical protein